MFSNLNRSQVRLITNIFYFLLVVSTWVVVILAGISQSQLYNSAKSSTQ